MGTRVHVSPSQFGCVEHNILAEFLFMTGPLADYPNNFDSVLSIFNFIPVAYSSLPSSQSTTPCPMFLVNMMPPRTKTQTSIEIQMREYRKELDEEEYARKMKKENKATTLLVTTTATIIPTIPIPTTKII